MKRAVVLAGIAALATMGVVVLALHGTEEEGLRAAIRAFARSSALCTALAFARIRVRESSALLPLSHAPHYAFIIAAGLVRTPLESVGGALILALMVYNALRPNTTALAILWFAFVVTLLRDGAVYVLMESLLLAAAVWRWTRRPSLIHSA